MRPNAHKGVGTYIIVLVTIKIQIRILKIQTGCLRRKGAYTHEDNREMNPSRTLTEFWAAKVANTAASFDKAEPPPAKSDKDLNAIKGIFCW